MTKLAACLAIVVAATSCRGDLYVDDLPGTAVTTPDPGSESFYLLDEGNMGSNRAAIDFFDAADGTFTPGVFTARNPGEVKELGDVGNDLRIYGRKMYAVINCSHKVQVLDAATCRSIAKIDIPNPRYAIGHGGYLYVSSYVSPVQVDPTAPRGAVFKVDTASFAIVDRVDVGYQPEQMAVIGDRLYVANSGGYRVPDYDNTISVIALDRFALDRTFTVAPNLHRLMADRLGRLLVTSRGNYADCPAALYALDPLSGEILARSNVPVTNFAVSGDLVYTFAADRNDISATTRIAYNTLDLATLQVRGTFLPDSLNEKIKMPYCIAVGPRSGSIYLTDARNYVSSGFLYCLSPDGNVRWSVRTGDIPCAIAFLP